MKISIIVSHPTQFEGPFYQFASRDRTVSFSVIFLDEKKLGNIYDEEMGRSVDWGIDILSGYKFSALPTNKRLRWLINDIRKSKYDLLIINGYNRIELIVAMAAARLFGVKVALRLDSVKSNTVSRFKWGIKKLLYPVLFMAYHSFFVTGSRSFAYLREMGIGERKIYFFSYAVNQEWFKEESTRSRLQRDVLREELGIPDNLEVIISVAKLSHREAPWDLLRALLLLPASRFACVIAGDGPSRASIEEFCEKHPTLRIVFLGYVPYPKLPQIYGLGDVFVHAAIDEPYGVSVAEALACGLPVIASSAVGSADDLIVNAENGGIYKSGDCEGLAREILKCSEKYREVHAVEKRKKASERILQPWNYENTWRQIKLCASNSPRVASSDA